MTPPLAPPSEATRIKRKPERGSYDAAAVNAILDAALIGHVGLVGDDGRPVVIPMIYGRDGAAVYLHGSVASRLARALADGVDMSLAVTIVDALVLARSCFHHSMNYRSVVVLGRAIPVEGEEKRHGMRVITEHLAPGRWDEARAPSPIELRQTAVLRLPIDEASAKIRDGGPIDDDEDLALDIWAGIVPLDARFATPVAAPDLGAAVEVSAAALALADR
ncbi:MAG: pyridoxamine 5'-phosphate oxidase family protein [Acidimicrobiales bacterium]